MACLSCILKVITGIPFLVRTVRVYAIHSEKNVPSAGASQKVSNEYPDYKTFLDVDETKLKLPTQSGFFFGSTSYDIWYLNSLRDTIEMLLLLLEEVNDNSDFYYRSSW